MESNILEHLENVKIFSDYKKSGLPNLSEFWNRINQGKSIENLQDKTLSFRVSKDYDPSEEELKKTSERREWIENNDLTELYARSVRERIINALEQDEADLPTLFNLWQLEDLISRNYNLKLVLATSENILREYIEGAKSTSPDDFFTYFEIKENAARIDSLGKSSLLDKYFQIPENQHNHIFAAKGFRLFSFLSDYFPKKDSDKAYIFWRLKSESYIHDSVGEGDFSRFLLSIGISVGRLKQLNDIGTSSRDPLYNLIHKLLTS